MSVDIREQIERLRKFADCNVPATAKEAYDSMASYVGGDHEGACIKQVLEPMVDFHVDAAAKAADSLESLLTKVERLESRGIEDMKDEIQQLKAENKALRESLKRRGKSALPEMIALRTENERLKPPHCNFSGPDGRFNPECNDCCAKLFEDKLYLGGLYRELKAENERLKELHLDRTKLTDRAFQERDLYQTLYLNYESKAARFLARIEKLEAVLAAAKNLKEGLSEQPWERFAKIPRGYIRDLEQAIANAKECDDE